MPKSKDLRRRDATDRASRTIRRSKGCTMTLTSKKVPRSSGAIQRCAGYGKDSAKEGSPTMATTKLSDEALLAFFQSRPELRDRMASIVGAVGNSEGNLVEADAAEERLVEEMRLLGRE